MKILISFLFVFCSTAFCICQKDTLNQIVDSVAKVKLWKLKAIYALNGSQTSFVNWNAGGRTNISLLGFTSASAYYTQEKYKWDTDLNLAIGGVKYLEAPAVEFQKSDDRIDFASSFGYKLKKNYYLSLIGGIRTQALNGYVYPNDSVYVSTFMAPGYINLALGFEYSPSDDFGIFISPFAVKLTFVKDQRLADLGSFGVNPAEYDELGNVVTAGKQFRGEFGAFIKFKWNKTVAKNIDMKSQVELFSNYNNHPENIDVNAETIFTFKVNSWFSASLQLNAIYDDDIDIHDSKGGFGPRTQFKSIIGIGISYTIRNYKEE